MKTPVLLLLILSAILIVIGGCKSDEVTKPVDNPPSASITSPDDGQTFVEGDVISFAGAGTDGEDGTLPGSSLVWESDKDGVIGAGNSFKKSDLSVNVHVISLTVTDSEGQKRSQSITIQIDKAPPVKILFIGNSYFNWNNLPDIFEELAAAGNRDVIIGRRIQNGSNLTFHAESQETEDKINEDQWDYVVMIGSAGNVAYPETHDQIPPNEYYPLVPALTALRAKILANCSTTKIVYCMPWAWGDGTTWLEGFGDTYYEMQELIYDNTLIFCDEVPCVIAPVGWAWYRAKTETLTKNFLFDKDLVHPSPKGSYLTTCVIYSTIFQVSTVDNPCYWDLLEAEAKYFQTIASEIVLNDLELWNITNGGSP